MTEQRAEQAQQEQAPEQAKAEPAAAKIVFTDPLAQQTSDDTDAAWGESAGGRGLDWYLSQRPPHHG
ncbi:hypothetical protein ACFYNO_19470 [Kitasatospora sp. NPDC006697]|uniref:hypothetical protein n=1 Tax=Kitasatospora sp. NPDC006697 TaxID=3364020 RepID=UPI0036BB0C35